MRYSSQFNKSRKTYRPAWVLSFTSLAIILYILISQRAVLRTYYETWMKNLPQRQVLEYVPRNEYELDRAQSVVTPAASDPPALLPSYINQSSGAQADAHPPLLTPTPASITQLLDTPGLSPQQPASIPDRLVIPAIQVDTAVIPIDPERVQVGDTWLSTWPVPPADKAGWHSTSATAGAPGNTVINGHNYPQDAVFRNLYKLQPADQIMLYAKDRVIEYIVVEILILPEQGQPLEVRQANARYIQSTKDERLTLVTCHPYASLTNRLIVIAVPAKNVIGKTK